MSKTLESPLLQWINGHVWLEGCELETEYLQARDEGRDLACVEAEFQRLLAAKKPEPWGKRLGEQRDERWLAEAGALVDAVQGLPLRAGYAYVEPSDLAGNQKTRGRKVKLPAFKGSTAAYTQRLHGGWLGRIAGCLLGKPVEGWRKRQIEAVAQATGNWPLADYFSMPRAAAVKKLENTFRPTARPMLRGTIAGMVEDDDTNYTTTGFAIVKAKGAGFTPLDVAGFWGDNIPIFHTCTAERVAYRNFVNLIVPPASATYRNPYREWIGAQIRADYFGYANPGNPARAAEWAWRDASISHIKNGIYGEMWAAAMLAAAFVTDDFGQIIRAGLAEVPAQSRLVEDVGIVLAAYEAGETYEQVVGRITTQWDENKSHHWCHTNSNAQIVAVALLYGQGDYTKTIGMAVMPGFDTDCNGATAGSVWGVAYGAKALPRKWTRPLQDKICTGVAGYHEVKISEMAREMADVGWKNR
ncbi:MAG: ADP-ribosylglycohydrolase family protein, partial [Phycisphaerae bacterium]